MKATIFEIINESREASIGLADIKLFQLRQSGEVSAQEILKNPNISLYSLDFENGQAVFVETPIETNLSLMPFYFITQYENANRVLTIPFESMIKLSDPIAIDDSQLVFIHSVGRCGSTLASQIFSQIPGVINMSEPDALTNLVVARNSNTYNTSELIALLKASIHLLCGEKQATTWVIKGRSFVIELGDWFHALFQQAKHIFLYRDAVTWLQSGLRAYSSNVQWRDEEEALKEKQRRRHLGALVPEIAQFNPNRPLSHSGALALMWISAMERYVNLCNIGIKSLAIRYDSWQQKPLETSEAMLEFCNCVPNDMTPIYETLNRDSQKGTRLSRETLGQNDKTASNRDIEELHWHLKNHEFINATDFEVPNTLML